MTNEKTRLLSTVITMVMLGASIVCTVLGLVMAFLGTGGGTLTSIPSDRWWSELLKWHPQGLIGLGVLILLCTSFVRVASLTITFMLKRDWKFGVVSALVLMIMGGSVWLGKSETGNLQHISLNISLATLLMIALLSLVAGIIGSLVGLGGGILLIPPLTLLFHIPMVVASGASIIAVIATSSTASLSNVRSGMANERIGMFLAIGSTLGAIVGVTLAGIWAPHWLSLILGVVLIISAFPMFFNKRGRSHEGSARTENWLALGGSYQDEKEGEITYQARRTPLGFALMTLAGVLSGLLGIGSGTVKVLALDMAMALPLKVSTATSTFMLGLTAATSAGIDFERGLQIVVVAPVAIGIVLGAQVGARLLRKMNSRHIHLLFIIVLVLSAIQAIWNGISH